MFKFFYYFFILIFITYYYLAKKDPIFRKNFIYIFYNFCDFVFFLILCFWESNLYSRFLIFAFGICYQLCTFKNPIFSIHFYLRVWLLAQLPSSPFDSPFSPPGHLNLLPPPSLLCPTLWISLGIPGCREHLGNRLLARSVSLLLTPPLLLLVTSISFLLLLFSL